jgi:hypothetical protein
VREILRVVLHETALVLKYPHGGDELANNTKEYNNVEYRVYTSVPYDMIDGYRVGDRNSCIKP